MNAIKRSIPWAMASTRAALGPIMILGAACGWNGIAMAGMVVLALVSDIFDGILARRWDCDTAAVRLFDTLADTLFYLCTAWALWLAHPEICRANATPLGIILGAEVIRYAFDLFKFGKPASYHSYLAKTWGLFLAFGVISAFLVGSSVPLNLSLWVGVLNQIEGAAMSLMLPVWTRDVKTIAVAWRLRQPASGYFPEEATAVLVLAATLLPMRASQGSKSLRYLMRFLSCMCAFGLCAGFCHAQTVVSDATVLKQIRAKYDAPFERDLQSFSCAVEFNWKQHFTEAIRLGDEGTDEEITKLIQPISNRVKVTRQNAAVSSGMTDEEEKKLPHGGMAEGLLEHAVQFSLNNWLGASNNAMLPPGDTPVHVESVASGYKLKFKVKTLDVEMVFAHDMSLQSEAAAKGSASDRRETEFRPGPQGLLMTSYSLGEDGDFRPGNRIILTYTYQSVGGFQLPEQVSINRESHHEIWHYKLGGCTVETTR